MAGTLRLQLSIDARDPERPGAISPVELRDAVASSHDYVDVTPRNVATGVVGASFVTLESPVAQVERFLADVPQGADLAVRLGGTVASVLGSVASPSIAGGETLELAVDGASPTVVTLQAGDSTVALVAKRINYATGALVASVDSTTGGLRLTGTRTGGADAKTKGWSYGAIALVGGTALTPLGLAAGVTYGAGDDQRVGPGLFAKTFPAGALPRRIELSGSALGARFWVAGKAA